LFPACSLADACGIAINFTFVLLKIQMNFSRQLLSWYNANKRSLPWRTTRDPYRVWLSEIIMQQTRIEQGLPYYEKFVQAWPCVEDLAAADEQEVLKCWQGLGYYSRARNLHETAGQIVKLYDGRFPGTYESLKSLKGVGDYTAAAIASIVFDLPTPVVDGNVIRFLTRVYGITAPVDIQATKNQILGIALQNIDHRHPGDFNQAMMEFGALVCTPANPGCRDCIFSSDCQALARGLVGSIPARSPKLPVRQRFMHYLVLTFTKGNKLYIYLNKRTGNDIWKNLYDFPQMEAPAGTAAGTPLNEAVLRRSFILDHAEFEGSSSPYTHILTHQKIQARFYRFHSGNKIELPYLAVPLNELTSYPIPRLIERYLIESAILSTPRHPPS